MPTELMPEVENPYKGPQSANEGVDTKYFPTTIKEPATAFPSIPALFPQPE